MDFVTDCDYCGEISLCFEDEAGGTCCHSCERAAVGKMVRQIAKRDGFDPDC